MRKLMTQLELLEIAHRAISRELKKKDKNRRNLITKLYEVVEMIRTEKEKDNERRNNTA